MCCSVRNKLISIIIPVYNTEKYLKDCVDSILNQTYSMLEIILVDDGSTDESGLICDNYVKKDSRIQVIHQENKGVSRARMQGVSCATGEYVMFVDSDDWVAPEICADLYYTMYNYSVESAICGYFRSYPNRTIPRILYSENTVLQGKDVVRRLCGPIEEEINRPEIMECLNTTYAKLYPINAIRDIKMLDTSEVGSSEDLMLNLEAFSKIKSTVYVSKAYYYYRKAVTNSITATYKQHLIEQWNRLYDIIRDYIVRNRYDHVYIEALENRIALNMLGIGLNCVCDNASFSDKLKRLKYAMTDPIRKEALSKFNISKMPVHWKVFYLCAQKQWVVLLGILLELINRVRGIV